MTDKQKPVAGDLAAVLASPQPQDGHQPPSEDLAGCVQMWYVPPYLGAVVGERNEAIFIAESAVLELLNAEVLFVNSRAWLDLDGATKRPPTLVLFLAGEDEPHTVTYSQLRSLYDAWKASGVDGVAEWKAAHAEGEVLASRPQDAHPQEEKETKDTKPFTRVDPHN